MLVAMISVDLVIAVVWTAVDPQKLMMVNRTEEIGSARGLVINRICRSQRQESAWLVVVMSYKVAQLIALVSLTLLTRHIPNKTFTNTPLRVLSYTFSAVFAIGFALYYCFLYFRRSSHANIKYTVLYFTLDTLMLLFILLVFVPPLTLIIRMKINERKQKKIFQVSRPSLQIEGKRNSNDELNNGA